MGAAMSYTLNPSLSGDSEHPDSTRRTPSGTDRMNRRGTDIRELLARVEGMIEGIRDAIQGHKAA